MEQACSASGSTMKLCILPRGGGGGLEAAPLVSPAIIQLRHGPQEQRLEAAALDPRTCPFK